MLLEHLKDFQGCTADEHKEELDEHIDTFAASSTRHYRLQELTDPDNTLCVMSRPKMLTQNDLGNSKFTMERAMRHFEGRTDLGAGQYSEPRNVCIHASDQQQLPGSSAPVVTHDVDSNCGYAVSMKFVRKKGCHIYIALPRTRQMQTDLHIPKKKDFEGVWYDIPHQGLSLDKATHCCFGYVKDTDATIYIYFPSIQNPSTLLDNEQHRMWTDHVLLPALKKSSSIDSACSLPVSWESARYRSTAPRTETRARGTDSFGRDTFPEYYIDGGTCESL